MGLGPLGDAGLQDVSAGLDARQIWARGTWPRRGWRGSSQRVGLASPRTGADDRASSIRRCTGGTGSGDLRGRAEDVAEEVEMGGAARSSLDRVVPLASVLVGEDDRRGRCVGLRRARWIRSRSGSGKHGGDQRWSKSSRLAGREIR